MKRLFLIGGTMGVGKSTVCQLLKKELPYSVFLDGDWCWDADPFIVNEKTKQMVMDNICTLLNNFLKCPTYENVIFCWVMHEQSIIDEILSRLDTRDCDVKCISLICSRKELISHLQKDIERGLRNEDVLERSLARLPLYQSLQTIKIDTSGKNLNEITKELAAL